MKIAMIVALSLGISAGAFAIGFPQHYTPLTSGTIECTINNKTIVYNVSYGTLAMFDSSGYLYRNYDDGYNSFSSTTGNANTPTTITVIHHEEQVPEIQFTPVAGTNSGAGNINSYAYLPGINTPISVIGTGVCSYYSN